MIAVMRNRWRLLAGVAVLAVLLGAGLAYGPALRGGSTPAEEGAARSVAEVPVTVASVTTRTIQRRVAVVGTLEGHEEVNLQAKVEGRVLRIHHDIGDVVAPGAVLAELDPTDHRLALNEAQLGLKLELAKLGLDELCDRLDASRIPSVIRARSQEDNARQMAGRARRLGAGRVIGAEEMEKLQTEQRVAKASREQAEMEAQATLASARLRQAQVETARQRLVDTRVLAPAPSPGRLPPGCSPGSLRYVVAARRVAEGEMVRPIAGTVLFRLVIDQPLKLVAQVPERHIGEVRTGQSVALSVEAYPGETFTGTVARLNPTVDRGSRSFTVEVHVPNESRRLRAGSFAKASILTRTAGVATVPEEAVVRFAGVVKVFVIDKGLARAALVRTGESVTLRDSSPPRRWVEVTGALRPGSTVVVSGQSQLADGTRVQVRK
jgi:multidrug efflux pump subunit AcrA (membrane-fusion protein)